jgi:hypothetical protein
VSRRHADYPALLAEALDVLQGCPGDVKQAAERLECTPSQLVGLLRDEPRALQIVNDQRQQQDLPPLR